MVRPLTVVEYFELQKIAITSDKRDPDDFSVFFFCVSGKVTVYLGKRDFIDHIDSVDPIDGIIVIENDYLQGRKVYGQVGISTTFL